MLKVRNVYASHTIKCDECDSMIIEVQERTAKGRLIKNKLNRPFTIHQNVYHRAHEVLHMKLKTKKGSYKTYCVRCYNKVKCE